MAEETQNQEPNQTQTQVQPQIVVHAQYVKDFSLENPNAPKSLTGGEGQPEIEINVNVNANPLEQERHFEVVLSMRATAKRGEEHMFVTELSYAAVLAIGEGVEERLHHPLVMIEGPRMLFPFARHILSSMTQAGGFMPLNIQPIDFVQLYQASVQAQQSQQNGGDNQATAKVESVQEDQELNLDNIGDSKPKADKKKSAAKKGKSKK